MSFKVVRNEAGAVVAPGPNEDWYEPGTDYEIETEQPVIEPTPQYTAFVITRIS